jgi:hypothetical protein
VLLHVACSTISCYFTRVRDGILTYCFSQCTAVSRIAPHEFHRDRDASLHTSSTGTETGHEFHRHECCTISFSEITSLLDFQSFLHSSFASSRSFEYLQKTFIAPFYVRLSCFLLHVPLYHRCRYAVHADGLRQYTIYRLCISTLGAHPSKQRNNPARQYSRALKIVFVTGYKKRTAGFLSTEKLG